MPLPSVVVMTVPGSPATLSRLLRAGSGRAKPPRPRLWQRLGRPLRQLPALVLGRAGQPGLLRGWKRARTQVVVSDPAWERGRTALWQPAAPGAAEGLPHLLPSFLLTLTCFLFLSFSFSYHLSPSVSLFPVLSSPIPSPPLPFPLPFPFPCLCFFLFPHCQGPMSLCLVPAGLFEHSLSAFTANPFPKSSPSIA